MRALALVLRPVFIFFGVTGLGYLLISAGAGGLDGYPSWLADLFPLESALIDALDVTAQLAVSGMAIGALLGAGLGLAMRAEPSGRFASAASSPLMALAGPAVALALLYWLVVRFDAGLGLGAVTLADDPGEAAKLLVAPTIYVALAVAPSLAVLVAARGPYVEPFGMAGAAAGLASRCEQRASWRFGFPAGLLAGALMVAELIFGRPGLFDLLRVAIISLDGPLALDVVAVIAMAGALLAVAIDLVGLRADEATTMTPAGLRLAGYSTGGRTRAVWIAVASTALAVLLLAGIGQLTDANATGTASGLGGRHLFGSDLLGRDVLLRALAGLAPAMLASLVPGLTAVLGGIGVEALRRAIGRPGEIVPGAVIDAVWWPLPVLAALTVLAVDSRQRGLLHPAVLGLLSLALVPQAGRMLRREMVEADGGGALRAGGIAVLLAGFALNAHLVAGLAGFDPDQLTLGAQMSASLGRLAQSAWPVAVPAIMGLLLTGAVFATGSGLVRLGWHHSASAIASTVGGDPEMIPVKTPGRSILGEPVITPNYSLQPGLPPASPYDDTVTLPIDGLADALAAEETPLER